MFSHPSLAWFCQADGTRQHAVLLISMGSNKKGSTHQVQNGSSAGHTSPSKNQKVKQKGKGTARSWKRRVWTKLEASLWVTGAAFFLWRGDGIYNLPDVIRLDDNVDR